MFRRISKSRLFQKAGFYMFASLSFIGVMIGFFTVFYHYAEKLSWLDALYFTVITTRTIGFGDIAPQTISGKIGTILNALLPATIFLGVSLVVLERLFQWLEIIWKGRLMKRNRNHTIIVADMDLLDSIITETHIDRESFVVVNRLPKDQLPESLLEYLNDSNYHEGDPISDAVLAKVRIDQAQQILIATSDDITNLYVLVTAKSMNPEIKTIVRVNKKETEDKFFAVGADCLLSTSTMLGRMFVQAAVHPVSHGLLVRMNTATQDPFLFEEAVEDAAAGIIVRELYPRAIAVYRNKKYILDFQMELIQTGDIIVGLREEIADTKHK